MTPLEASKLVATLMACYPAMRFPDGTVVAYESFIAELELERAKRAIAQLVRTSKFMPAIAEIVTAYEGQKPRSEVPYHRRFAPPKDPSGVMRPRELKAAIDEFLAGKAQQ